MTGINQSSPDSEQCYFPACDLAMLRCKTVCYHSATSPYRADPAQTSAERGNYEDRHPNDMVLHPLSEIREWDEALAVLGIQDSDQTPADAIRERDAEIEQLRAALSNTSTDRATP